MSIDWNDASQEDPQLEAGTHDPVTIVRAIHMKNNGEPMMDKEGNPQLVVTFRDDNGQENAQFYKLKGKWKWMFAQLVVASGLNIEKMKEDGIGFEHFQDNEFASSTLCNRQVCLELTRNGNFLNAKVTPTESTVPEQAPAETAQEEVATSVPKIDPSDIPF